MTTGSRVRTISAELAEIVGARYVLHTDDVVRAGLLAPAVLAGAVIGYATVRRVSQRTFDVAVLLASALAAAALLLG